MSLYVTNFNPVKHKLNIRKNQNYHIYLEISSILKIMFVFVPELQVDVIQELVYVR